jgi:hypothetical protein
MTQVYEVVDSQSGSISMDGDAVNVEVRRRFVIGQCEGFTDCVNKIVAYAPPYSLEGGGTYWVRSNLAIQGVGNRYFDVTATYRVIAKRTSFEGGDAGGGGSSGIAPGSISWDTSGNTERITQAYEQERLPAAAPDFEGAINVNGDRVDGVDVVRPCLRYSETWMMPASIVRSSGFLGAVYSLTGTVNKSTFRDFDAGEALFMGARGQWQSGAPYAAITFEFEARPNIQDWYAFPGVNESAQKKGWEHVWIRYEGDVDANSLIQKPVAAYKSEVYKEAEWDALVIVDASVNPARTGRRGQSGLPGGNGVGQ